MEQVKMEELTRWGWECPNCDHWNETEEDPDYQEFVKCETCNLEFEPVAT
jgi:peptide subunit release factor 1 (eRF1)